MDEVLNNYKQMVNFVELLVRKLLKPRGKELIENLKAAKSPKAYNKALNMLMEKYLNNNRAYMRYI